MSAGPRTGRPRVRPAIRRLAFVALVVLVPIAAHRIWDHVELRRLIREIETIRANGEPVTRREAASRNAGPDADPGRAGPYYLASGLLALPPLAVLGHLVDLDTVQLWIGGATDRPPSRTEMVDSLRAGLEPAQEALALADTGAALPFREFPSGTEYRSRAQGLFIISRQLAARTVMRSLAGDGDGAIESALSALQFRRGLHDFGLTGTHETAAILSLSTPSVAQLVRLQRALEAEDDPDALADVLLRARAEYIEQLWRRYYGSLPSTPPQVTRRIADGAVLRHRSVGELASRPWLSRRIVYTLRIWSDAIDAARTPWPQRLQAAEDVRRRYESETTPAVGRSLLTEPDLVPMVVWWGPAIALEELRMAVRVRPAGGPAYGPGQIIVDRSAQIAIAIERYRRDHAGALPDTLDALVPAYLSEIPADPLTGASLLYRVGSDAYTIYSVGENGVDDGGVLLQPAPSGSARPFVAGPDIGVRVLIRD